MSCQKGMCLIISFLSKIKVSVFGHLIHLWTLLLFIMQRLCRFYLHGLASRNADADGYHQGYQQEADDGANQESVPFQVKAVVPCIQLGKRQVEVDNHGQRGDDEQQQPSFAEQAGEHHPVGRTMGLVKGDFALSLLGAEPEGAEQAEEDVHEQEDHSSDCVSHSIVLKLLEIASDVLERTDITDIDVSDAELLFAVRFQAFDEIHVLVGTDTDAEFLVVIPHSPFEQDAS
mgnify:CR=1 FL=1